MKNKLYFSLLSFLFLSQFSSAQMWNGKDTLYGNEWINYSQTYFKMKIANDGLYRLDAKDLTAAGIPLATLKGENFKIFALGKEVPLFVSNKNTLQNTDYIEFYGKKNRGELDAELYVKPNIEQINPNFSMYNDTISYFLTWGASVNTSVFAEIGNDLTAAPAKEIYYLHRLDTTFVSFDINAGGFDKPYYPADGDRISKSSFGTSEGFASNYANTRTLNFNLNGLQNNIASGSIEMRLGFPTIYNNNDSPLNIRHKYEIFWNNTLFEKDSFPNDFRVLSPKFALNGTQLSNISTLRIDSKGDPKDKHRIAYVTVNYPKSFNFENKKSYVFNVEPSFNTKYIEIQNFNAANGEVVLYDLTNNQKLTPLIENGLVKFVLPNSLESRKLLLINTSSAQKTTLLPTNFVNFQTNKGDYIIVSSPVYYKDTNGKNWVQEYADYRASVYGGNHKSIIVESQQLYDQFAYGVDRHAISMRNFANFATKYWKPQCLFLIGKGLEYREARNPSYFQNFGNILTVPTFGFPGSDNLISATKWSIKEQIATGRIPINTPEDIRIYLKKIKEFDQAQREAENTVEGKAWMKNIVHLSGDNTGFKQSLLNMENVIRYNQFAGNVTTFYKTSTDPVQSSNSELLRNLLKKGTSIVNYYGHSAASNISFSLDGPDAIENKGRYFYFLAHGCNTGQIHTPTKTIGPSYIFQEDGGAIAFTAPSSWGLTGHLDNFGNTFYSQLGGQSYGKGIGEIIKNTINTLGNSGFGTEILNNMTLCGDPAVKLNPSASPDYIIELSSLKFEPEIVTTFTKSFKLNYKAYNIGRNRGDTVSVSLIRELPNGTKILVKKDTLKDLYFSKDFSFTIPGLGDLAAGKNKFYLKIDADNKVNETPAVAEANNDINEGKGIELYIQANDVNLLTPSDYSIVNQVPIALKMIPSNVLEKSQKYIFEIDTTLKFNSNLKQRKEITQAGGIISWTPNLVYKDSTVYYWRVSPDSVSVNQPFIWKGRSFVYIKNSSEGWNQSHFFQFQSSDFKYMDLLNKDRRFSYQGNSTGLVIKNDFYEVLRPAIGINELSSSYAPYAMHDGQNAGVMCWVFNDTTGLPWVNRIKTGPAKYNSNFAGYAYTDIDYIFPYRTNDATSRKNLMKFLDTIPSKSYVIFLTAQYKSTSYMPELWESDSTKAGDKNIFNILEKQGAKLARQMLTSPKKNGLKSYPYFFFYRKNDPTFVGSEKIADPNDPEQPIAYSTELKGYWYKGSVKSINVGAASKWSAVHWKQTEVEKSDTAFLNIYGVKKNNQEDLLVAKTLKDNIDISNFNADTYPNLRLEWYTRDTVTRTTPQLRYWRVLYDGVPEAVPNAAKLFKFNADTLQQGQFLELSMAAENVTKYDMKNLLVKYSIKKTDNTSITTYQQYNPLLQNDTVQMRYRFDTRNLVGKNALTVEINPNKNQPEQDSTNNLAFLNFYVEKDRRNPNLDVTFDGQRIINGDIISPEPNIVIELKDENKYVLLEDTSLFKIAIRYPGENKVRPVAFDGVNMKFFPAKSSNNNRATVELAPKFDKNGDYQLLVRSTDMAGNKTIDYELLDKDKGNPDFYNHKVNFKVLTKSSISNVLNYPNPFTTSTRFVYTLTGKEPPVYFKIQIMTVSGKVVRELTQTELGALKIGTHQTEQAWDGTDTYGDRLANGVYLYKMIAKKANGEDYESYESGADQFMKNGVGKLVILR